jgi:hypothetical protein
MNGWDMTKTVGGKTLSTAGEMHGDEYRALFTKHDGPRARVNVGYSESSEYGASKVSASVTLECDQNEATISKAAELAYVKAREIVDNGWQLLQLKPDGS